MEKREYEEFLNNVVNPALMVKEMPNDKIWLLLGELDDILDDFDRELAIAYIGGNHSENKHMCTTYLRGKNDEFIIEKMEFVRDHMQKELKERRKNRQ